MFVAGAYVTAPGGGGEVTGLPDALKVPAEMRRGVAANEAEVRQRVRELLAGGADFIKVIATGAVFTAGTTPSKPEFTEQEIRAAVEEAARAGTFVAAHAHGAEGIKNAVRAGVRTIEHGSYLDDEGIQLMLQHGTWLVADIYNGDYTEEVGTRDGWSRGDPAQEPRDHRHPAPELREGGQGRRAHRLRHGRGHLPARRQRAPVRLHGQVRHDAARGDPRGDDERRGLAGPFAGARLDRARQVREHHCRQGRSARGRPSGSNTCRASSGRASWSSRGIRDERPAARPRHGDGPRRRQHDRHGHLHAARRARALRAQRADRLDRRSSSAASASRITFAALARKLPQADGPFGYVRSTLGESLAFPVLWSYWISCWVTLPVLAIGATGYFLNVFPAAAIGAVRGPRGFLHVDLRRREPARLAERRARAGRNLPAQGRPSPARDGRGRSRRFFRLPETTRRTCRPTPITLHASMARRGSGAVCDAWLRVRRRRGRPRHESRDDDPARDADRHPVCRRHLRRRRHHRDAGRAAGDARHLRCALRHDPRPPDRPRQWPLALAVRRHQRARLPQRLDAAVGRADAYARDASPVARGPRRKQSLRRALGLAASRGRACDGRRTHELHLFARWRIHQAFADRVGREPPALHLLRVCAFLSCSARAQPVSRRPSGSPALAASPSPRSPFSASAGSRSSGRSPCAPPACRSTSGCAASAATCRPPHRAAKRGRSPIRGATPFHVPFTSLCRPRRAAQRRARCLGGIRACAGFRSARAGCCPR